MGRTVRKTPKQKVKKTCNPPSHHNRPPETTEPETDQVSGSDTDQLGDGMQASPVATLLAGLHKNLPGPSTKATPPVYKLSKAHKDQAEKAMPAAPSDETDSEDGSTPSETSKKSKMSGRKSPDTHRARCVRTKESDPLMEATLKKCLLKLIGEIRKEFRHALANEKEKTCMSKPFIQNDIVKELVDLKKEMIESRLFKLNEVTITITTTRQHMETMNQGLLQAIFDQLANHTPFTNGNMQIPSSSSSDPIPGNGPTQGTFLFKEDPCIPTHKKGEGCAEDLGTPKSEPKLPAGSPHLLANSPLAGPSQALPQSPNPSELKKDPLWWQTVTTQIFLQHTADVWSDSACPTPYDECGILHYQTPCTQLSQVFRCFPFLL